MSDRKELSLRLNDVLDMVGASEKLRNFHQGTAATREILTAVYMKRVTGKYSRIYYCGSFYEGSVTPDLASDVDVIKCPIDLLVIPNRSMAGPGLCFHTVKEDWTRPGFVKLQLMSNGRPLCANDVGAGNGVGVDREGRLCAKHLTGGVRHGPAEMFVSEDGRHTGDKVDAYQCKGIPLFAKDWITRNRLHGWPSQELMDELKMMGCLFVGVGHFETDGREKEMEWRLSFSVQERRLMMSLNPIQHKVYILLKMLRKNVFEAHLKEETLSSYMCKTCVFYMAETTPASMWVRENLISCLFQCLTLLLQWIRDRFCPSFFLTDSNLFDKEGFSKHVYPLEMLLGRILNTGQDIIYSIQSDNVGAMMKHGDLSLFGPRSDVKLFQYKLATNVRLLRSVSSVQREFRDSVKIPDVEQDSLSFYLAELEEYEHGDGVPGYTQRESRAALRFILPWLHLSIGLEFAVRAVTCQDKRERKDMTRKVKHHLKKARNTDLVNVRLARTSILLRQGKLEKCFLVLQEIENCWTHHVGTYCPCKEMAMPLAMGYVTLQQMRQTSDLSVRKLLKNFCAICVIFQRSQREIVPTALWFEMYRSLFTKHDSRDEVEDAWLDGAAVDAKVYLYLLQYLVCSKLNDRGSEKQAALESLASLIQLHDSPDVRCPKLRHMETALNLLGWVYLQERRVVDAMWCFLRSWRIRPHHNAAKFHVLLESYRLWAQPQSTA